MTARFTIEVVAWPQAEILSRVLGTFAQLSMAAPDLCVASSSDRMKLVIVASLEPCDAAKIIRKMSGVVGVDDVRLARLESYIRHE